jgi:hypothetical protein
LDKSERPSVSHDTGNGATPQTDTIDDTTGDSTTPAPAARPPRRFHGSVTLNPARVGRDAGVIAEEVISHLAGLVGANVTVTLEIEAEVPNGAPENVVRTVTENSRALKFTTHGFESD